MMPNDRNHANGESFPWHIGIYDAHCHPTDTVTSKADVPKMKARVLTIMATRGQDQHLVAEFADDLGTRQKLILGAEESSNSQCRIMPSFGWHPWYSHLIYEDNASDMERCLEGAEKVNHYQNVISPSPEDRDFIESLPDPYPLSQYLAATRDYLNKYPYALVGEIGLDRAFRIPESWLPGDSETRTSHLTPGGREGRRLSPYRVGIDHQRKILTAQLHLAGELQRPVSLHGVSAHGVVFETLRATWQGYEKKVLSKRAQRKKGSAAPLNDDEDKEGAKSMSGQPGPKPFPPRICLHSYSGPPDTLKQYLDPSVPTTVFFSFSKVINLSTTASKAVDVIKVVPNDRLLIESDLHCAGAQMDDLLEEIVRSMCSIKGWSLDDGVKLLAANWFHFIFGEEM